MIYYAIAFLAGCLCGGLAVAFGVLAHESARIEQGEKYLDDIRQRYGK